ncbi:MAG: PadR family transcriptional regulator [Deltaproteobacteria bacterium]|jgi:DNA-binding PadR family transcriptional regulator|nr:PadR family transcriptional regulator [Deltaproteobacteria bacterium]
MDVKTILLGSLFDKSLSGYDLKKIFSLSFAFFSDLSYGSIYPALKKLEQAGLITMKLEIQENAPNRKVYTITEAGKQSFLNSLKSPFGLERYKDALLMRMFFFEHLSKQERLDAAGNYLEQVKSVAGQLEAGRAEVEAYADRYQLLCFQFGLRFFKDLIGNIEKVIADLQNDE